MAEPWNAADEAFGSIWTVQEGGAGARRQPGPRVQPMPGEPVRRPRPQPPQQTTPAPPPPQVQPPAAPQQSEPWNAADDVFGSSVFKQRAAAPPQPTSGNAEPDADTWLGRRWQDITGKRDPRYKDLPTLQETNAVPLSDVESAKLTMPNDAAFGDIMAKGLDDSFTRRFKDANGYEIIGFKDKDGKEVLAYVNRPGLDMEDVGRTVTGALPFMVGGGVAGKGMQTIGAPLIARMAGQSATAGAVSVAQDAVAYGKGSEQGFDAPKAIGAIVGAPIGEAAAPVLGAAWRRFVTEPGLFKAGKLTPKGEEAARSAGFDPAEMTAQVQQEFAKQLARAGDARAAGVKAELGDIGIPTTAGQRSKDVAQLTREQEMRDGMWGEPAAKMMKDFDQRQWQAMVNATMGEIKPGQPGMSLAVQPARSPGEYAPGQIGAAIADRAAEASKAMRATEKAAWQKIGTLEATDPALAEVPTFVNQALGGMRVNRASHPTASAMIDDLSAFMKGEAPESAAPWLTGNPARDVNAFRQSLSEAMRDMPRGPDKTAAGRVYDGLNSWVREMAERNMLTASTADAATAAANMVAARGVTRRLHEVLDAKGNPAGANILKQVLEGADSPEQVVRALFVGPTAKSIKPGSIAALRSLKEMAGEIGEEGKHLVSDLKLAYWLQVVRNPAGKEGENIFNPQTLLRNLRVSSDSQRTVWQTLFTPQEIAMRNRLIRALENGPTFHDWTIKPNSSRSGTTVGRMFMDMLGGLVGTNWAKTGVQAASSLTGMTRSSVNKALSQDLPAQVPYMIGPSGAAAGAGSQQ